MCLGGTAGGSLPAHPVSALPGWTRIGVSDARRKAIIYMVPIWAE